MKAKKNRLTSIFRLLKETAVRWYNHEPFRNSAILSYYAIFSLPGIAIIVINLAGIVFGKEAVREEMHNQLIRYFDSTVADSVGQLLSHANLTGDSLVPALIGIVTILFGATGVFYQLQQSLNSVWNIKPVPKKALVKYLRDRLFSFGLVLAIGFILLVSLILSSLLLIMSRWVSSVFPYNELFFFRVLNYIVSFGLVVILIALIYKFLPDVNIRWRDVLIGSLCTAVLFEAGKYALSIYFGNTDPSSGYGAAGSMILLMLWFSYSSLILLFGAEFTFVQAKHFGEHITPSEHAVFVKEVEYKPAGPNEELQDVSDSNESG